MQAPDFVALFVVPLNNLGIPYMVTGAVAVAIYGEPRFTRDLDLVLALSAEDLPRLAAAFPEREFYLPPLEALEQEAALPRGGQFNLIHLQTALKADCYLSGDDPLHAWAMPRRVSHDVEGVTVWAAPIEYVVIRKLDWYRQTGSAKHLDDVRGMLRVGGNLLLRQDLMAWIIRLGLKAEWAAVSTAGGSTNTAPGTA